MHRLFTKRVSRILLAIILAFSFSSCSILTQQKTIRYIRYVVNKGDSLNSIAKRFRVETEQILEINEAETLRPLRVGVAIRVPYTGQKLSKEDQVLVNKNVEEKPVASAKSVKTVKLSGAKKYIGKLHWPIDGKGRLASRFGKRWFSFHEGIDIAEAEGTEILAAAAGEVVYSGSGLKGYGNLVVIRSPGILCVYGHNKRNRVRVGEVVKKGDHIADLGSTGKSTGPHLHFETRIKAEDNKNIAVDPLAFFP